MTYLHMPIFFIAPALALFLQAPTMVHNDQDILTRVETIRNDNNLRDRPERKYWTQPGDAAQATIVVILPEDARLTFDGEATRSTGSSRLFVTPPLERGRDFHYTLEANFIRNGKAETTSRQITVRAGQETRADLLVEEDRRVAATAKPETRNRK